MTASPAHTADRGRDSFGERAARTLTAELARHAGPKTALVVGAAPGSAVLQAAIDALLPGDALVVTPGAGTTSAALRSHVHQQGQWVGDRVRVAESVGEADPAQVVIVGEALTGSAEDARATIDGLAKYLADGGVLTVAAPALPGLTGGAAAELDRQAALFGVGSDLVLANRPPVRVHRLRFSPADAALAERLAPAYRPSSVPLTRSMHIDSNGVAAAGIALGLAALTRRARPTSKLWLVPALAALPGRRVLPRPRAGRAGRRHRRGGGLRRQGPLGRAGHRRALRRRRVPADRGLPVGPRRARQPQPGGRQGGRLLRHRRRLRGGDEAGSGAQRGRVHGARHRRAARSWWRSAPA